MRAPWPVLVNDHDFRSDAIGIAIPYGVYDLQANRGTVFVGTTYDTPTSLWMRLKNGGAPRANIAIAMPGT